MMSKENHRQENIVQPYPKAVCPRYRRPILVLETWSDEDGLTWWRCYLCLAWHLIAS
ncbi:MAG: hypothetical protein KDJ65_00330 [Anaerolineae bacterium]|nr:hypothetical protein [Anaerolineae bacterium]